MSIFSTILSKLGIKPAASAAATGPSIPATVTKISIDNGEKPLPTVAGIPVVDVVAKLEQMAKQNPEKLDWKVSIVDLLKLLGMDSSLAARKELATELGCPADKIGGDYSQMNVWLHQTVLQKIADNGGNIPAYLLHK